MDATEPMLRMSNSRFVVEVAHSRQYTLCIYIYVYTYILYAYINKYLFECITMAQTSRYTFISDMYSSSRTTKAGRQNHTFVSTFRYVMCMSSGDDMVNGDVFMMSEGMDTIIHNQAKLIDLDMLCV